MHIQQLNSNISTTSPSLNKLKPTLFVLVFTFLPEFVELVVVVVVEKEVVEVTFENVKGGEEIFDALVDEFEIVDEDEEDE